MKITERGRLRRSCLALAFASSAALAATDNPPRPGPDTVARFDAVLAGGLPATIATGQPAGLRSAPGTPPPAEELTIRARLASRATFSDGGAAELYDVRFRGGDAVAIRHGDSLRISSIDGQVLHTTAFTRGHELPVEAQTPLVDLPASESDALDEEPPRNPDELSADPVADEGGPRDLHVLAFVHDDVVLDDDAVFERFFAWWVKRMEFDVLEDRRVHVHLRRTIPGLTDPSYGYKGALFHWARAVREYTDPDLPGSVGIRSMRNILLVKGREVEPRAAGIADHQPGSLAMASIAGSIVVPAHEIGHTMGASHDHAERRFTGPFSTCDTIMYPVDPTVPCKAYSLPNVQLIRNTMRYKSGR
ncbi:hypothetical protein J2T07_002094 [Luteibacter jiangsuensis]|uniref:Reprolysin-like metallo-peptidase family M12B n=1 Tax=Luteibacter jiangsuensis TaxID=637577 RepID=A0ABT9SY25_9GAMM|nr:hypothetical protein [Luteibacter jiangsuensis]MDQ0009904.1 hypothetical protein [Luteibacter jiangsuensis]